MPQPKTFRLPDGEQELNVQQMQFETVKEDWNEYRLEDGTVVRVKNVAVKMFRVLDDDNNPAFTEEREPYIIVRSRNLVSAR